MRRRRQGIPDNRVDLEIEMQDSDKQLNAPSPFDVEYVCICGRIFTHSRVPQCLLSTLRCPECKGERKR